MSYRTRRPSFWEIDHYRAPADVTVVGAGLVGATAALRLRELHPTARIVLLERDYLPAGASTRNAGFACFGAPGELLDDLHTIGPEATARLVQLRLDGLRRLRTRIGDAALHYRATTAHELLSAAEMRHLRPRLPELNALLRPITGREHTYRVVRSPLRNFSSSVEIFGEGQIHPAKMMDALRRRCQAAGVQIQYGTDVDGWEETPRGVTLLHNDVELFDTQHLLLCTNGFAAALLPALDVLPARNQVLITRPLPRVPTGNFHFERGYVYFRNVGNRLLLGGGRHLDPGGETTAEFGSTQQIQHYLTELLTQRILPGEDVRIAARWSGILGVGPSREPVVRMVSERIGVAVRLGGMGVAIGSLVGERGAALFGSGSL